MKNSEFLSLISTRRSYRGEYEPTAVPREDLSAIMTIGCDAPSGCNKQTTSFIAVDDAETLARIRAVIDPPVAATAPAMICVLTRRINAYRDKCFAVQDYSAAIENMLLAIHAMGYSSCWIEGHITDDDRICDRIAAILNVPREYDLVCILPVGIAKTQVSAPKKDPVADRAFFNGFGRSGKIDPVACCGLSCAHCFLAGQCPGCRSGCSTCSYGSAFEDHICPNTACCREKKLDGCYECDALEQCTLGFYTPENDGAAAGKAQAMAIRKYGKAAFLAARQRLAEKNPGMMKTQQVLRGSMYEAFSVFETYFDEVK